MLENVHLKKLVFEYSKITEFVFVGSNQCCTYHFKKELLDKGVKADVSLEEERLDQPFGVDYYLWLPVKERESPSFKQLLIGANFIKQLVDNNVKVYVHCEHGHARAPTLVAAYMVLNGLSVRKALELIKKKRPVIHLHTRQLKALEKFAKLICETKRAASQFHAKPEKGV